MAQVAENWPSKDKVLSSTPVLPKNKKENFGVSWMMGSRKRRAAVTRHWEFHTEHVSVPASVRLTL
jgi:hypothetical protein